MFSTPRSSLPEIAADYPRLELLESGHIQDWLSSRAAQLSDRAHVNSNWADWLKLTSLLTGGLTAGLALSTPLAPAILLLSLTSYFAAVGEDREITRAVYPVPWIRMTLMEILRSAMDKDYREKKEFAEKYTVITLTDGEQGTIDRPEIRIEKEKLFTYLSLEDRSEATMLMDNLTARKMGKPEISAILAECPSKNRFLLYRLILREYQDYGNLALSPAQIQYLCQEINDYYELDQKQIDRFSGSPTLPSRRPENALQPIAPLDNYFDPVARQPVQQPRIEPIVSFAPPDDRPPQSQRKEVVEPEADWVLDLSGVDLPPAPKVDRDLSRIAQDAINKSKRKAEDDAFSIIKRYATMRQNLLVLSVGGGGKGILLSNLFRFRAESDPNFFAYWIDPKQDESESGYFDHTAIVPYRFNGMECKKEELAGHIRTSMQTYRNLRSEMPARTPNWLCFDEWTSINHRLKNTETLGEVHDYVAAAVSLLDGQNSHLLLVGQSPKLSDIMAEGGGLLSNFSAIVLFKREDRSFKMFEKCQQCGTIPKSIGNEKLYAACDQSPVNRAIYIDGQLLPMPKLPNYSSYDRDSGVELSSQRNDRDIFANLLE